EFATVRGAHDLGLSAKVGTLTPGKEADIVAISAEDINNMPLNNAVGTIVQGADSRNVDLVLIGGQVRKWRGKVVGQDLDRIRQLAYDSRDYLAAKSGWNFDSLGFAPGVEDSAADAEALPAWF